MFRFFIFYFLQILYSYSQDNLGYPVGLDYTIHPGEGFCDEMYYHSYHSRKYHTAVDLIKKWNGEHIFSGISDYKSLLIEYQARFQTIPEEAKFWSNPEKAIEFMKINLYREGLEIVDTKAGLYPREFPDLSYGHGDFVQSIFPGTVIAVFNPDEPKGWGKSILIEHNAPPGMVFSVLWNSEELKLKKIWSGYFHNSENLVTMNDRVQKGQNIAKIGDANGIFNTLKGTSGIREGSHLHFEIRIRKYGLFPEPQIQTNLSKLKKIYIDPIYFLQNAKFKKN